MGDFLASIFLTEVAGALDRVERGAGDHACPLPAPFGREDRVVGAEDHVNRLFPAFQGLERRFLFCGGAGFGLGKRDAPGKAPGSGFGRNAAGKRRLVGRFQCFRIGNRPGRGSADDRADRQVMTHPTQPVAIGGRRPPGLDRR